MEPSIKDPQQTKNVADAGDQSYRPARRFLRNVLLFSVVLIALYFVGVILMSLLSIDHLRQVRHGLKVFGEWWLIVRLGFIAGLAIYWLEINTWLSRRNGWTEAHLTRVLAGRWLTLGVLIFVELFLVQRIHEPFTDRWFQ